MAGYMRQLCAAVAAGALAQQAGATSSSSVYVYTSEHLHASEAAAATLSEADVSFLLARLSGQETPLESKPPTGLPAVDIFHQSAGAVVLVVTGADADAAPSADEAIAFPLQDASSTARSAVKAMLSGNSADDSRAVAPTMCVSLDRAAVRSACSGASGATMVAWDTSSQMFTCDGECSGIRAVSTVDRLFTAGSALFAAVGLEVSDTHAVHTASGASLDLTDAITVQLLAELQLMHQLPAQLPADRLALSVLTLSGLEQYAEAHARTAAAAAVVAAAVPVIMQAWDDALHADAFKVAVFRHNAAATAGRRLLQYPASSTTGYTSAEIGEFQVFTWTWFTLIFIVFFAACSLGGLDIGSDEAGLYSTFKAGSYDRSTHEHDN